MYYMKTRFSIRDSKAKFSCSSSVGVQHQALKLPLTHFHAYLKICNFDFNFLNSLFIILKFATFQLIVTVKVFISLNHSTIVAVQLPSLDITFKIFLPFQVSYIHHQVYTVFSLALAGGNTTK